MIVKALNKVRQEGFVHALSTMGWILIIISTIAYAGAGKAGIDVSAYKTVYYALAGISGICIFFFGSPGANPFLNIGIGLWDTYNMLTGLLGRPSFWRPRTPRS
ncbi:MAG: hypothetical protein HC896_17740, partial [Bacteroidales bacterium]|nr:hypothetical protein [Bacteroidales bacterium]